MYKIIEFFKTSATEVSLLENSIGSYAIQIGDELSLFDKETKEHNKTNAKFTYELLKKVL